jgi:putative tryptophan/tyrosine transport system substrate-binding protein
MRRREFITLIGGAVAWPLAGRAQQTAVPVIGLLDSRSPDALVDRLRGFRLGLKANGYVEGDNVTITYRWAENNFDRLPELAADLVRRRVAVIAATGPPLVALAAKAATATMPIVFLAAEDPVRVGLVASLAHPGGNLTGVNFLGGELVAKQLELMREMVSPATRVAVLVNPANVTTSESRVRQAEAAARAMALQIQVVRASTSREINAAYASFEGEQRPDALFVGNDAFFSSRRIQIVQLAAFHKVPTIYSDREFCETGGLMSYGSNIIDAYRQVGTYTGLILKGAKPDDLPIMQSSKFELVINAETARMLGLNVPATLLVLADEVIE